MGMKANEANDEAAAFCLRSFFVGGKCAKNARLSSLASRESVSPAGIEQLGKSRGP
jgi:hypothetical protein